MAIIDSLKSNDSTKMSFNRKDSCRQGRWSQAGSIKRVRLARLTVKNCHVEGPACSCHFFVASQRLSFLCFDVSSHDSLKHVKVPGLVKSSTIHFLCPSRLLVSVSVCTSFMFPTVTPLMPVRLS